MKKVITCLLTVLLFSNSYSQDNNQKEIIDDFITSTLQKIKEIPSLSISVQKDGKPFFMKSYGYSNVEAKTKATPETSYYIASMTKSFVGLLAAKLDADGIIDLDEPIVDYKPIKDFKDRSLFEGVTIRDLLSHTSGIENAYLTAKFASIGEYDYEHMYKLLEVKTEARSNKKYRYDNFGYNVFDLILKDEFGLSWKDLLKKEIFKPLKMKHTSANISEARKKHWNLAIPYASINDEELPREVSTQKNDDTFQAAGGMISSIQDMEKYLLLYLHEGALDNKILFKKEIIQTSIKPNVKTNGRKYLFKSEGYGLGWHTGLFDDKVVNYHGGSYDGFRSYMSFLPKEKMGVVTLTNENHLGDNVSDLVTSFIYDLMLGNINSASEYSDKVNEVVERAAELQAGYRKGQERMAKRSWTLMHDFDNYIGIYRNKHLGDLIITTDGKGNIKAKLGISEAIASPSSNDESIRVEFKNLRGENILFISNSKGTMAAVNQGDVFLKEGFE
ncbi:serine hydrolase domain-containing protein [uncultured Allomuricauda sp.]|uniref:serine hydrolase domain-containing protein n=1 Tax=Flagellimonas sp. W118 TaxID=3410791 RepID=UPI002639B908|nr:serine hydrolase domain-containing protein [uncultured Allomuricauda sp.]